VRDREQSLASGPAYVGKKNAKKGGRKGGGPHPLARGRRGVLLVRKTLKEQENVRVALDKRE